MRTHGYRFDVVPPPISEPAHGMPDVPASGQAEALAYFKARSVGAALDTGVIVGADTIVAAGATVLGKPHDRDDARAILNTLAGTTHDVVTGVALLDAATGRRLIQHDTTTVTMHPMTDAQIQIYLDTDAWRGKAGAYGIQDHGDAFVARIDGSFTNVVGLPMELLGRMLAEWGIRPTEPYDAARANA